MYSGNNQTRIACSCGYELLLANTPTPPVNESWETKREELADILRKYDCNDSYLFGSLEVFFKNVLSTARQEAILIEKEVSDSHKQLYDQLKDKPSYDAYSNDYKHGILRGYTLIARFIDSLTSKGGTND